MSILMSSTAGPTFFKACAPELVQPFSPDAAVFAVQPLHEHPAPYLSVCPHVPTSCFLTSFPASCHIHIKSGQMPPPPRSHMPSNQAGQEASSELTEAQAPHSPRFTCLCCLYIHSAFCTMSCWGPRNTSWALLPPLAHPGIRPGVGSSGDRQQMKC